MGRSQNCQLDIILGTANGLAAKFIPPLWWTTSESDQKIALRSIIARTALLVTRYVLLDLKKDFSIFLYF